MSRILKDKRAIISLLALFTLISLPLVQAQSSEDVKLPETPAGKTFAAFLVAFNSGDIEVMRKFHNDRKGNPENAERDLDAYKQTGGLKLIKVNSSSDYALEVLVETKSGAQRLNFAIEVDHNAPHGLLGVQARQVQE
jgi:hypothetical protein